MIATDSFLRFELELEFVFYWTTFFVLTNYLHEIFHLQVLALFVRCDEQLPLMYNALYEMMDQTDVSSNPFHSCKRAKSLFDLYLRMLA